MEFELKEGDVDADVEDGGVYPASSRKVGAKSMLRITFGDDLPCCCVPGQVSAVAFGGGGGARTRVGIRTVSS